MRRYYFVTLLFTLYSHFIYSQKEIDTHFVELNELISKYPDTLTKIKQIDKEVSYSREKNNLHRVAAGLKLKIDYVNDFSEKVKISDNLIKLGNEFNNDEYYAQIYLLKSNLFFGKYLFKDGLELALLANSYCVKTKNFEMQAEINASISMIKSENGQTTEALNMLLENYKYYKRSTPQSIYLAYTLMSMIEIYLKLEQYDNFLKYINIFETVVKKDENLYPYANYYRGIYLNQIKKFEESSMFFSRAEEKLKKQDPLNYANCLYYKGDNIYLAKNKTQQAKKYFEKTDSIITKYKRYFNDSRLCYIRLMEVYKKEKNYKKQAFYSNKLMHIDSILTKNGIEITNKILKDYDNPSNIRKEQELQLKQTQRKYFYAVGVILILFFIYGVTKIRVKQKNLSKQENKYNIQNAETIDSNLISNYSEKDESVFDSTKNEPSDLIKKKIRNKIENFEKNKGYLNSAVSLQSMSKEFGTNTTHLSYMLNNEKNLSFTSYIKDLRIQYVIEQLHSNKKFRNYDIKSMAKEAGFIGSETFTKAFKMKTNMSVLAYVKSIKDIY